LDGFPAWLAVALLFPVLWIGIGAFLAWVGGWTVLARAYRLAGASSTAGAGAFEVFSCAIEVLPAARPTDLA
jgi:hypothetical protein